MENEILNGSSEPTKKGSKSKLKKNLLVIIIIGISGAIIYGLPYFRLDYYDAYRDMYGLTNLQVGTFGSIFGIFGMVSYLFGGYVADRFSIKKLIGLSLIGTGIGGSIHLLSVNYYILLGIYALWGFTSLFAFWPACVKAVRMLSNSDEQGRAFGIFEGIRGTATAIVTVIAVLAFKFGAERMIGTEQMGDEGGLKALILFYTVACIVFGILVLLFMKDEKMEEDEKMRFSDVFKVLKLPAVWIIAIVTFCNYVFTMSHYYFVPYMTSFLGVSVVLGATVAAGRRYISPVSNIGGGFLGDKVGTSNLLFYSFLIMALCTFVMIKLPIVPGMLTVFLVIYFINFFFYNVNYSLTWAMMEEGNVPLKFSGTAAGIISTIGYLPEVFCSLIAGKLIDSSPDSPTGYHMYFYFVIAMLLLGAIFVLIWKRHLKNNKKSVESAE